MFQFVCTAWKSFSGKFCGLGCVLCVFDFWFKFLLSMMRNFNKFEVKRVPKNLGLSKKSGRSSVQVCAQGEVTLKCTLYQIKPLICFIKMIFIFCSILAKISPLKREEFQIYGFRQPNKSNRTSSCDLETKKSYQKSIFPWNFATFQPNYQKFWSKKFPTNQTYQKILSRTTFTSIINLPLLQCQIFSNLLNENHLPNVHANIYSENVLFRKIFCFFPNIFTYGLFSVCTKRKNLPNLCNRTINHMEKCL